MSTDLKSKGKRLEAFFREVDGRNAPAAVKERRDLFADILLDLERPTGEQAIAVSPAMEGGAQVVRERWKAEYDTHKASVLAGHPDESGGSGFWSDSFVDSVTHHGKRLIYIIILLCLLLPGVVGVYVSVGHYNTRRAAEAQQKQRTRDAFTAAGWRQSETRRAGNPFDPGGEKVATAYAKDISPDEGRVHMLYTDNSDGTEPRYEISGWTQTTGQREAALAELRGVFGTPGTAAIEVRPSGGTLQPGEGRAIVQAGNMYTPEGQKITRLEYGLSGYLIGEKSNVVTGTPPAAGTPYIYVMGGGGTYWKTPQQRQQLIDKAFERLRQSPDKGKGATAIRLIYYDGNAPVREDILISPTAETKK